VETRANTAQVWRFGVYEVDVRTMELRRGGTPVKLREQSFNILVFLLEHAGELVTREDLRRVLWPSDTFVDFDHSLNTAVMKLREALGDSADTPLYIETIPKRGYRFIAPVEAIGNGVVSSENGSSDAPAIDALRSEVLPPRKKRTNAILAACCALVLLLAVAGWFAFRKLRSSSPMPLVQRGLTQLTSDEGLQTGATWSPDGRFLAYSSDRAGKYDIWIQQISGGDPIQITKGTGQNWMPDWSPDGKYIAYRSEEGDGGIYITPALGGVGQQRKIANLGYFPHWSPDSSLILFQPAFGFLGGNLYVVGLDGSPPREVRIDQGQNRVPLFSTWHPDGKRITTWISDFNPFVSSDSPIPNFSTKPIDGGPAIESKLPSELQKQIEAVAAAPGIAEWRTDFRFAWAPSGKAIYFERTFRGARNVWRMTVDPVTLQPTRVERLTTSPGLDAELSVSPDGNKIAFTSERQQVRAWVFPFEADHGRVTGSGAPITSVGIEAWGLNLSRDGTKLGVGGSHNGQVGTWEISVPNGREETLVAGDSYIRDAPIWSPDGNKAAYVRRPSSSDTGQLVLWSSDRRNEEVVRTDNSPEYVFDWSSDGNSVLVSRWDTPASRTSIWQLFVDSSSGGKLPAREITSDPNCELYQPHFSPDGKWIVFEAVKDLLNSTLYAIPTAGGRWIQITNGKQWDDKPRWSPDGRTVYYLSERKGFYNVWGIHFDPAKGAPQGEAFQVTSFESPSLMIPKHIAQVDFSLASGRLVLPLAQASGNIWILDNVDR
jgi:Tol biopolymer transport system component/DNA-binding winged helix-turn-helix (wHTH) protein